MLQVRHFIAVTVLVIASFALAAPALAQGTKIVVVDQTRVLTESAAGQDIATKIQTIQEQMQRELEPSANSLEELGETIQARTANMTPEALQADTELQAQARDYQTRLRTLSQESDRRATELAITERKAQIAFAEALKPVLEEVMAEKGAEIMLAATDVMIALPSVNVTDEVISKLNSSTPTIAVTRERLPAQQSQQQ
ncbi:MAG: OmpH family outer membrane protein [Hyphomonadaceae bacterium]|nr:OmpH family outer membrane protein [Hyphomonadaceae bacterium]